MRYGSSQLCILVRRTSTPQQKSTLKAVAIVCILPEGGMRDDANMCFILILELWLAVGLGGSERMKLVH